MFKGSKPQSIENVGQHIDRLLDRRHEMVYPLADQLADTGVPFVFVTGFDRRSIPVRYARVKVCEKPVESELIAAALFS